MDSDDSLPRSVVAYELARRLIYHTAASDFEISPVRSAQARLDVLLAENRLAPADHHELGALLRTVEGCDADRCGATDELVTALTRHVAALTQYFPDEKLRQLADLM